MQKGFIQIPLLVILVISVVAGGASYVAHEASKPGEKVAEHKEKSDLSAKAEGVTTSLATTTSTETQGGRQKKATDRISSGKPATEDNKNEEARGSLVESLKKQIEELKRQNESEKNHKIITFPSGAIVETDENGNIIRYIKEPPTNTNTPATNTDIPNIATAVDIQNFNVNSTPRSQKNIADVRIEWNTNIPADSKIFLTDKDGSVRLYESRTGFSTNHFVAFGSEEGSSYDYELEAIADSGFAKESGMFTVKRRPASIPTQIRIHTGSGKFLDEQKPDFAFQATGARCGSDSFEVVVFDQYESDMADQEITLSTPAGSITAKTAPHYLSNKLTNSARFVYNPASVDTYETISLTSSNLVATATMRTRNPNVEQNLQIKEDGTAAHQGSGQGVDPETLLCLGEELGAY